MGLKLKKIIGVKSSSEGQKKELPRFREEKLSHKNHHQRQHHHPVYHTTALV